MNKAAFSCLIMAIFMFPFSGKAQDEDSPPFSSFGIQFGSFNLNSTSVFGLEEARKLNPNSEILQEDYSAFEERFVWYQDASTQLSFYITLPVASKKLASLNPQFRIGISHQNVTAFSFSKANERSFRVDTLQSTSGENFYVDSIASSRLEFDYAKSHLMLDAAFLISSNPNSRWRVISGLGLAAGVSYDNRSSISFTKDSYYRNTLPNYGEPEDEFEQTQERYRNDPAVVIMAYVPMMLDFRIARKEGFFNHSHLYLELRPMIQFEGIPELEYDLNSGSISSIGYRYEF